jgi:hypothetical protein
LDKELKRAVLDALTQIPRRAERLHHSALTDTFVEIGSLFSSLRRPEHQVMYGRRGTGKTHALGRLEGDLRERGRCVVSVDLRTIGSASGLYFDPETDMGQQATRLLIDVVEALHSQVLDFALLQMESETDVSTLANALDFLGDTATEVEVLGPVEAEESSTVAAKKSNKSSIEVSLPGSMVKGSLGSAREVQGSYSEKLKYSGQLRYSLKLGPLSNALRRIVQSLPFGELWVLLDEWSSVSLDLQPFLADLLRRAAFPIPGLVVKIAAIERRSKFVVRGNRGTYIGIELGADAAQDVNLDDYLIFRNESDRAEQFFADLFLKHGLAIAPQVFEPLVAPDGGARQLILALCESRSVFSELVQAAEGVPRDGINIAGLAAQSAGASGHFQSRSSGPMTIQDVRSAARAWYLRDKEGAIAGKHMANRVLINITAFVATRRKRIFLIRRGHDSSHEVMQELYDARLIHLLSSGVGPQGSFDLFALDYGGYANIIYDEETAASWDEGWHVRWTDFDPSRSPEVHKAILEVSTLLAKLAPDLRGD